MMRPINWGKKVLENYRERIIVDPDNPILAFKASRDRYTNVPSQKKYSGLPYLGSRTSEDTLTWNIFRTLQKNKRLDIITGRLNIGDPRGLLLWTLAPEIDNVNAELQFIAGSLIRRFDGVFRGQMTEPDVIVLGTKGIAVIECKLSEPGKAPTHLWEGSPTSVDKRLPEYLNEIPNLISEKIISKEITPVYQLVRMAFYAMKLGAGFQVEPVIVSLANEKNWLKEIRSIRKSPAELWGIYCKNILGKDSPRCESLSWQSIRELVKATLLDSLAVHLSTHPCL